MLPGLQMPSTINANMPVWRSEDERKRGIVLHRILQHFSEVPSSEWTRYQDDKNLLHILLQQEAVNKIEAAVDFLQRALQKVTHSKLAQWILKQHEDAQSELELQHDGQTFIIDRSFIDQGKRWIIDYKSAIPAEGESTAAFIQRQHQMHAAQLEQYAKIMRDLTDRPIELMLYFPLIDESYVWTPAVPTQMGMD